MSKRESKKDKEIAIHNKQKMAAIYIRVSTDDQLELSPDAQLRELHDWASKHGYYIPEEHIYIENEGISGKNAGKRPAFQAMIKAAKSDDHPFDVIAVWKFSRFARNQEESIVYKNMLKRDNVEVVSIKEPIIEGPFGSLIERIIEWQDEYYLYNLSSDVKRGMTEKALRGGLQSIAPFGYKVENNTLIPVPDEAEHIREIFRRFINGEGLYPLARWLNELGVRTHRGNKFENRTIEYIINNPAYIGKLRWNPTGHTDRDYSNENIILSDAAHEPLIDIDTWEKAQKRMANVKSKWRYKNRPVTELNDWLSGVVRCASCNGTLLVSKDGHMKCNNYSRGRCTKSQYVKTEFLRESLMNKLENDLTTPYKLVLTPLKASESSLNEIDTLRKTYEKIEKKKKRLNDAFLAGLYEINEYKMYKDEIDSENNQIIAKINELKAVHKKDDEIPFSVIAALTDTVSVLKSGHTTLAEKHEAITSLIETCVFDKTESVLSVTYRISV